jgi:hypothetical protein
MSEGFKIIQFPCEYGILSEIFILLWRRISMVNALGILPLRFVTVSLGHVTFHRIAFVFIHVDIPAASYDYLGFTGWLNCSRGA